MYGTAIQTNQYSLTSPSHVNMRIYYVSDILLDILNYFTHV